MLLTFCFIPIDTGCSSLIALFHYIYMVLFINFFIQIDTGCFSFIYVLLYFNRYRLLLICVCIGLFQYKYVSINKTNNVKKVWAACLIFLYQVYFLSFGKLSIYQLYMFPCIFLSIYLTVYLSLPICYSHPSQLQAAAVDLRIRITFIYSLWLKT